MKKSILFAVTALTVAAIAAPVVAANVLMVREKIVFNASADEVWKKIGDICAIESWHPAVKSCEQGQDGDNSIRTLTLIDGGTIQEAITDSGNMSYKYTITESPLPVEHYKASFKLKDRKEGKSMLIWSASFAPKGTTDAEAKSIIDSIFKAGIEELKAQLN